jgi:hypothetical protein
VIPAILIAEKPRNGTTGINKNETHEIASNIYPIVLIIYHFYKNKWITKIRVEGLISAGAVFPG